MNFLPSNFLFICWLLFSSLSYADSYNQSVSKNTHLKNKKIKTSLKEKNEEPPKIGNFSVPSSQQPGSFIAFGENIFDKGTLQINMLADYFKSSGQYTTDIVPNIIYATSDTSSIYLAIPYAPKYKQDTYSSRGIEDIILQYEYAFYTNQNKCFTDQATVVMNVSIPTGSASKHPSLGFGSPACFLGTTFLRTYIDWVLFTSHGITLTSSDNDTKLGNVCLYQFGIGRNIAYQTNQWIFNWVLELTGQCTQKNKIKGERDPDSGGNVIFLTPSLWYSTKDLIVQVGAGKPIVQNLFGNQNKNQYILFGNIAWTF